jgi:death-on-curing protein
MVDRVYLTLDDVLYLHDEQLRLFGGGAGTRDEGLILSALLRPQTGYYADLIEEAAALWESLAMNHGFIDGNKRVAFAALLTFLGLNGLRLTAEPDEVITFIYRHLEAGTFRKDVLDPWLRADTAPAAP